MFLPSFEILKNNPVFRQLSEQKQTELLAQGLKFKLNKTPYNATAKENFWVRSVQDNQAQSTARLYNELMAYEVGLHYVPDKPETIPGQQPW